MTDHIDATIRVLRIREVCKRLSISKSTIYDWMNPKSPRFDGLFPRPVKIGRMATGWLESEINEWLMIKADRFRSLDHQPLTRKFRFF